MEANARVPRWLAGFSLGIGALVLLNRMQVTYFLYYPQTTHTVLLSNSADLYLFLASGVGALAALTAFSGRALSRSRIAVWALALWAVAVGLLLGLTYGIAAFYVSILFAVFVDVQGTNTNSRGIVLADTLVSVLTIFVLLEFAALCYWAASSLNPQGQFGLASEQVEEGVTYSLSPLATAMVFLLLFLWFWVPILSRRFRFGDLTRAKDQPDTVGSGWRVIFAALDLFMILALVVFFYTYLAGQAWVVGVDSYLRYLLPLTNITGLSLQEAIFTSYRHGVYVVLLYLVEVVTGLSSVSIVKFAPLFLAFATASAVFLALLRTGWGLRLAIVSAIIAVMWLPTTLGIYAGIQANWMALLLWMIFLVPFLTKQKWNIIAFAIQSVTSLAMLFIHPWTWGVFLVSLGLTAIISVRSPWSRRSLQGLAAALALALPLGFGSYELLPSVKHDFAATLATYTFTYLNPAHISSFGTILTEVVFGWASFLSPTLLLIAAFGGYGLAQRSGITRSYLLAWTATLLVASILVAPIGYTPAAPLTNESDLWRVFYVSPFPFLLGLGVEAILEFSDRFERMLATGRNSWAQTLIFSSILPAFSAGLFVAENPILRLTIVLAASIGIIFVLIRFPKHRTMQALVTTLLLLLLANACYRSLYPLLRDPHNLFGSFTS